MKMPKFQVIRDFLQRLSKRDRIIFYAAVLFVSLAVSDRLIINPIVSRMQILNGSIKDREGNLKRSLSIIVQKDRILEESAKYGLAAAKGTSDEDEMTQLLKEIETLAGNNSVDLFDMKPAGQKAMDAAKKYMVNLNCEAQMEKLAAFIFDIENSDKFLTVERYQISPKSKGSNVASCSMTVSKMAVP